jgi:OmpA-OmpF porin, OOP family
MFQKTLMFIFCTFVIYSVFFQNLVQNPSFEEVDINSTKKSFWLQSTKDWFPVCHVSFHFKKTFRDDGYYGPLHYEKRAAKLGYNVPYNMFGKQYPRTGDAYIQFGGLNETGSFSVGVFGKLTEPLKRGHLYYTEFYVSKADNYPTITGSLWISFSDTIFNCDFEKFKKYYSNPTDNYIADDKNWKKISGTFYAAGGEKYIAICSSPDSEKNTKGKGEIHFFIDDVLVEELKDTLIIEPDKPLVLKNIVFSSGSSDLLPASYPELDKLTAYLKKNPDVKIGISGHTDNTGKEENNRTLSQKRAEAVVKYLVGNGVEEKRLSAKGYGEEKPISSNETEEGKSKNRRVEVKIIK